MKSLVVICAILFSSFSVFGQYEFLRNEFIPVYRDGVELRSAWAGGLNSPQFSRVDLNGDGFKDIFVFDRIGNRILTFVNTDASPGVIQYDHQYEYVDNFPEGMRNWVLLRDFNCDDKEDLFTSQTSSMKLFKNIGEGEAEFEVFAEPIFASFNLSGTPFDAPLYSLTIDMPSIADYEGDGDLDVVTWTENSTTVYYFENLAVDNGNCDTVEFVLGNRCYGQFAESSESFDLLTNEDFACDFNVIDPLHAPMEAERSGLHAGGSIVQIDLDQNGIKDLVISDIADDYMKSLLLAEDSEGLDSTFYVADFFPEDYTEDQPAVFETFPTGYYLDVDNDGIEDFIASPNGVFACRDYNSCWLYKNTGATDLPSFDFIEENFLQKDMIDVGRSAYPIPVDYNSDGLMDIVVANDENYITDENRPTRFLLMKNVGTSEYPEFNLADYNYADMEGLGIIRAFPAFGDLDNDSDPDMVVGNQDGELIYFENQAEPGEEPVFVMSSEIMTDSFGEDLDVGQVSTPQLFDIDNNGTLDLIVGEKNGNINLIRNNGTAESYSFDHEIDTIGGVIASNFLGIEGYSVPFLWRNEDSSVELLVGSEVGEINHYTDIEGNLEGEFTLVEERMGGIWEGTYSGACHVDFTGDGIRDLIYGQVGGGLAFYQGGDSLTIGIDELSQSESFVVYPNPANDLIRITLADDAVRIIRIYDISGRLYKTENVRGTEIQLNTSDWNDGIYIIQLESEKGRSSEKVIIRH